MSMWIYYKRVINPLYTFEKVCDVYAVSYPSRIEVVEDSLYEIDDVHQHKWLICKLEQLVKITIRE